MGKRKKRKKKFAEKSRIKQLKEEEEKRKKKQEKKTLRARVVWKKFHERMDTWKDALGIRIDI